MKRILLLLLLLTTFLGASAQQIKTTPVYFNSALVDMKAYAGTDKLQVFVGGLAAYGDANPGAYRWDSSSTVADDGFITISVTGVTTGRWIRIPNGNTIKGSYTGTASGLVSSFTIAYGSTMPFVPSQIYIEAKTANAVSHFIAEGAITNTGFTVSFVTLPASGPLSFNYLIIKQ